MTVSKPGLPARLLASLLLVSGALLLSACGDSDDSSDPPPATDVPATTDTNGTDDATGTGDAPNGSIDLAAAEKIALAAVGNGTVTDSGAEDDQGAAWEVEITRPNGTEVDVLVAADGSIINTIEKGRDD